MTSVTKSLKVVTLEKLFSYQDEFFIQYAYLAILGRSPDPDGMLYYSKRIRSGTERMEILAQLRNSNEGKSKSTKIEDLDKNISEYLRKRNLPLNKFLSFFGFNKLTSNTKKKRNRLKSGALQSSSESDCFVSNFDTQWYIEQNTDVKISEIDAFKHYILYGKNEGRLPAFDSDWYLRQYPDVASNGINPRIHYSLYGKHEGRHPAFDADWYLNRYPDVAASGMNPLTHYVRHGQFEGRYPAYSQFSADGNNYPKWVQDYDTLTETMRTTMRKNIVDFSEKPIISVVMPVYNPNPIWLAEVIESVRNQIYPNWELCIADDLSSDNSIRPILEQYAESDPRIKVIFREKNGHISNASNSALELVSGEWIALLDHDDILPEHALYWVVDAINKYPKIRMIYSDEDKINENGSRFGPYFKCDWNEDLFYSHNMFSHLGVYHAQLIRKVGGFRIGLEGSQDYDLALRCIEHIDANQIHHIPRVLYHWRLHAESTASSSEAKPYAMIAGERAITEHLERKGVNAKAELIVYGYRVRYALPQISPLVSLIIPTRNGLKLLEQCVGSIISKTTYPNYEILVVDNGSDDFATLNYLREITSNLKVRVIRDDRAFNYSALNNAAVKLARGEIIGLVNNDIEVISPDWLSEMVSHALRPNVGAVGAKLLYPNDTVQHAGVLLGVTGIAAHAHKNLPRYGHGYFSRANLIQSFSAVTAACLVVKKSIYESIGGLNEIDLKIAFNDVDFCIRLCQAGYKNIWTPYAELYHHESATRGYEDSPEKRERFANEVAYMERNSLSISDPAYSPNLTLDNDDFSLAWPPRVEQVI
jgi:glycosyltransferase involved in cell wall biosynthesis